MITVLYLWVIVAAHAGGTASFQFQEREWQYMGEYASPTDCNNAVRVLGTAPEKSRCVPTGKKVNHDQD